MTRDRLVEILGSTASLEHKIQAIEEVGDLRDPKCVGTLVRSIQHSHFEMREAICDALGMIGDLRATQPLLSLLKDEHEDVRGAAFSALFQIGETRSSAMPAAAIPCCNG